LKTEKASFAYGGPHKLLLQLNASASVDYKGGKLSNLLNSEFSSHRRATLFILQKAGGLSCLLFIK
jgi:hypothetical protein